VKAIVTGGSGFVGSNLALELQKKGAQVTVIDDFTSGHFKNLSDFRGDVIAEDVNEFDWERMDPVDVVFHEAAITDTTVMDQKKMTHSNVEGFRKVLHYATKNRVRLVYASTAALYGNNPAPQDEEKSIQPLNIYAFSKLVGDQIALEAMKEGVIPIVGLRYFNVFGLREQYKGKVASMIFQLAEQMRQGKRPRIFFDGEQKRDHIYVKDVVRANLLAAESKKSGIVNVGTGKATTFNRLIEVINDVLGTKLAPEYFDNPYGFYQNHTEASTSRAKALIGFEAKYSIEEGIRDYLTELYQLKSGAVTAGERGNH